MWHHLVNTKLSCNSRHFIFMSLLILFTLMSSPSIFTFLMHSERTQAPFNHIWLCDHLVNKMLSCLWKCAFFYRVVCSSSIFSPLPVLNKNNTHYCNILSSCEPLRITSAFPHNIFCITMQYFCVTRHTFVLPCNSCVIEQSANWDVFLGCPAARPYVLTSVRPPNPWSMPWGNFFGTNIHLNSRMNSDFGGQRPYEVDISEMPSCNAFTLGTNIHLESRIESLDFGSQRSSSWSGWPHKVCSCFSWMWNLKISLRQCLQLWYKSSLTLIKLIRF